ncbi:MAG: hypothetical protein ABIK28_23385 [Planctomycetota bacterium]
MLIEMRFNPLVPAFALLLFFLPLLPFDNRLSAKEVTLPPACVKSLASAVNDLANQGREQEAFEVMDVMEKLGVPPGEIEKLQDYCRKMRDKVTQRADSAPKASQALHQAAKGLVSLLDKGLPEDTAQFLAEQIVRLDSDSPEAKKVLQGAQGKGEDRALGRRRKVISEMLRSARQLQIPLEVKESDHPVLKALSEEKAWLVRSNLLEVHTLLSRDKAERIVRESLRALALSSFLVRGKLEIPNLKTRWVLLGSREVYERAVEEALVHDGLLGKEGDHALQVMSYIDRRGFGVLYSEYESFAEAQLLCCLDQYTFFSQACLRAGHLGWVCYSYLGVPLPDSAWYALERQGTVLKKNPYDPIAAGSELKVERSQMMRRARAGLMGCRSWIIYLAYRREDPLWTSSMVKELGQIRDNNLLKCTIVAEYLQEQGPLQPLMRATAPNLAENVGKPAPQLFETALQMPLDRFEARWREWLLPAGSGLKDRVMQPADPVLSKEEQEVVKQINRVRKQAIGRAIMPAESDQPSNRSTDEMLDSKEFRERYEVQLDRALSDGVKLHMEYLRINPEQVNAWPDAHEEYPDKEGFTVQGSWAGAHALVSENVRHVSDAMDIWMGSFYHRIPLLHPGLLCVGWAREESMALLEAGSYVVALKEPWAVMWPYDGMTDVPLAFQPETPSPVPEVKDLSSLGYPVTLQLWRPVLDNLVIMTLYKGEGCDEEVPCYYTCPASPLYKDLVPEHTYCLIPKSRLDAATHYTVKAESIFTEEVFIWTFKTGRKS